MRKLLKKSEMLSITYIYLYLLPYTIIICKHSLNIMNYGSKGFGTQGIIWFRENWSLITMPHPSVIATKGAIWPVTIYPSITII